MKWWQRIFFSAASLIGGFISLDYLYFAFGLLTNSRPNSSYHSSQQGILIQLAGAALFLVWFLLMAVYTRFLRSVSLKIDYMEKDSRTGKQKVKRKWFDLILQYAFMLTGAVLRWGYLKLFLFS